MGVFCVSTLDVWVGWNSCIVCVLSCELSICIYVSTYIQSSMILLYYIYNLPLIVHLRTSMLSVHFKHAQYLCYTSHVKARRAAKYRCVSMRLCGRAHLEVITSPWSSHPHPPSRCRFMCQLSTTQSQLVTGVPRFTSLFTVIIVDSHSGVSLTDKPGPLLGPLLAGSISSC